MADEMKALVRRRGTVKSRLTLFKKNLTSIEEKIVGKNILEVKNTVFIELRSRVETLKNVASEFEEIQNKIEVLCEETDFEDQIQERGTFEDDYFSAFAAAKAILEEYDKVVEKERAESASESSQTSSRGTQPSNSRTGAGLSGVKLPQIKLPVFNGSYDRWLEFKDTFESLIHSNESIGDIQKFIGRAC